MIEINMKIDAFRVLTFKDQKLDIVLEKMLNDKQSGLELKKRNRNINGTDMRFEDIEKRTKPDGTAFWLIDFINLSNNHGPGKASLDTEIEPFEFDDELGEKFSYDAAMFYDENSEYVVLQYNHQGVKSGAIAKYFSAYDKSDPKEFELKPVLREDMDEVLSKKTFVKKIMIGVDTRKYTDTSGPLMGVIENIKDDNDDSDQIYIEVSVRGKEKTLGDKAVDLFNRVRNNIEDVDSDGVTQLKIGVSDGESSQELLDFVNAKLSCYEPVKIGNGYRVTRDERWDALQRVYNTWVKSNNLA